MAVIYISYRAPDRPIADRLSRMLSERGHIVRYDKELYTGSEWRSQLMTALKESDGVLLIWSKETESSQYVPSEVGAARALPKMGLFPVMIGDVDRPLFISDVMVDRLETQSDEAFAALADRLDDSFEKHFELVDRRQHGNPRIFISHRHKDEKIVRALAICLRTRFKLQRSDIRCTSVRPYRLPVGEQTGERLREEISTAEVILGILTPDTQESSYVLFELGSAWGQKRWTCPLLARSADQSHIPHPIRDLSPLSLEKPGECWQLMDDLLGFTSLEKTEADQSELNDLVNALVDAARES
ncbi:MAG: toll/interleukin-1 receptor domain-containing protein [Pseudomonadota bacterium]